MSPVLHRHGQVRGHRRPRRALPEALRQEVEVADFPENPRPERCRDEDFLFNMNFRANIEKFRKRAAELEAELANPAVYSDQRRAGDLARELQGLKKLLGDYQAWQAVQKQIVENKELAASADLEMADLAKAELQDLNRKLERLERDI